MISKIQLFTALAFVLVYMVTLSECTYTDGYYKNHQEQASEQNKQFFQMVTKHSLGVGKPNQVEDKAWEHFFETFIPQMFKECNGDYYSINRYVRFEEIPCTQALWLCLLSSTDYREIPYFRLQCYDRFQYYPTIVDQGNETILIDLQLQAITCGSNKSTGLFNVHITMDYAFNVLHVESYDEYKIHYPVFGKGHRPMNSTCEYLQANIGNKITL